MQFIRVGLIVVAALFAGALSAQPLTGTYTCANGNPGSAFNYGDIGTFFDALEANGVSGPVTLNVFDDGGPFTSTLSYSLGRNNAGTVADVAGLGAANPLVIQAAPGEHPVVNGAAAPTRFFGQSNPAQVASISFEGVSYVTLDGFELTAANGTGISAYGDTGSAALPVGPLDNIKLSRCIVHGYPSIGICFYAQAGVNLTNCVIENCFVYNVGGDGATVWSNFVHGAIGIRRPHTTTAVRHTTVLLNNGVPTVSAAMHAKGTGGMIFENNVFVSATSARPIFDLDTLPVLSNYNVLHTANGGTFHNTVANFAAWQTAGQDANGTFADPLMMSVTAPFNVHLQVGSPAIDRAVTSTVNIDIDGDVRPIGAARDSGADEVFTGPPPEIEVQQGVTNINDGGAFAAGNVSVAGVPVNFTVRNTGVGNLVLTGTPAVALAIVNNCDPTTVVQVQPAPTSLPTNQSAQFTVLLDPTAVGAFSLTITINNNDPDENPFNFTINGNAVPANAPAVANAPAGSSFAGPTGGPFTQLVNPGAALAAANIELTDVESDTITVTSIVPPAASPLGIVAPVVLAPGHPLMLAWTGTADASNPPGIYTWTVNFEDAASGIPSTASVSIQVANIAPAHVAAAGQTGDGSVGNPYAMAFSEGVNGSISIDFSNVSDANLGQVVMLTPAPSQTGGPAGTGFQFSLAAGVLAAAPAGTLVPSDVGVQQWLVTLSDGALSTQIRVSITVNPAPTIVTTSLPDGMEGTLYSESVTTTGGTGTLTVTLLSGTLPGGITVGASGLVSGTPTVAPQTTNFVLTVTDTQGSNSSRALSITIQVNPALTPVISTASPLPIGEVDAVYVGVTFAATQGTPAYTWSQPAGTMPPGLTLSTAGALAGTPTTAGAFSFTVRVTDSALKFSDKIFNITIDPKPVAPGGGSGGSTGGGGCAASSGGALALPTFALLAWRRRRS